MECCAFAPLVQSNAATLERRHVSRDSLATGRSCDTLWVQTRFGIFLNKTNVFLEIKATPATLHSRAREEMGRSWKHRDDPNPRRLLCALVY